MNSIKHTLRYLFCFVIALLTAVLMTNIKKELFTEEDNIPGILLESAVGNGRNSKFLRMKDVAKALDKLSGNNKTTAQRNLLLLTRKLIEHRNLPLDIPMPNLLFYNAVPKTGSQSLEYVMGRLAEKNKLQYRKEYSIENRHYSLEKQHLRCLTNLINYERALTNPDCRGLILNQHMHFVDCTKFNMSNPTYFTSVRDPFDTFVSTFRYRREIPGGMHSLMLLEPGSLSKNENNKHWLQKSINNCILTGDPECTLHKGKMVDRAISYFCGMTSDDCVIHGSKSALHIAKENIEKWFPVVMVLEHRELSLKVMEAVLPQFFKDVFKVPYLNYVRNKNPQDRRGIRTEQVKPRAKALTVSKMTLDYELYQFLCQRLTEQAKQLGISN